ncbi:MAG: Sir2 family NAD-dependent protein deacetylase [Alkalispirochaeta sp.]
MSDPMTETVTAVKQARRVVVFTGAGVSTDSGIPDYRGSGGQYERYQPVYYEEFVSSEAKRIEYWTHKASVWPAMRAATPGPAHTLVRTLADQGRLQGVITQNIDGLHEKSGVSPEFIVNLHGTNLEIECTGCGRRWDAREYLDPLAEKVAGGAAGGSGTGSQAGSQASPGESDAPGSDAAAHPTSALTAADIPLCPDCGALLKPATIMFGQSLSGGELVRAEAMLSGCDLMLAMGSTLTVQPAASIPMVARNNGAKLVIVTRGETPLDEIADYRVDGSLGEFAVAAATALRIG